MNFVIILMILIICNDINRFILLLRKGIYPYECIESWEGFDETSLPHKENFYSSLNTECKFKNQGDYHDLYVKNDTILLADVFETSVLKYMNLIQLIFCLHHGKLA